jgi:hypothetical protein
MDENININDSPDCPNKRCGGNGEYFKETDKEVFFICDTCEQTFSVINQQPNK